MNKSKILKMLEYCGMSYSDFHPYDEKAKLVVIDDKKTDVQGFVKIKDDKVKVTVDKKEHDVSFSNSIMRLVQEQFDTKKYITVEFKG